MKDDDDEPVHWELWRKPYNQGPKPWVLMAMLAIVVVIGFGLLMLS